MTASGAISSGRPDESEGMQQMREPRPVHLLVLGVKSRDIKRTRAQLRDGGLSAHMRAIRRVQDLDRLIGSQTWHGLLTSPQSPQFCALKHISGIGSRTRQIPILVLVDSDEKRVQYAPLEAICRQGGLES